MKVRYELVQISYMGGEEVIETFKSREEAKKAEQEAYEYIIGNDLYTSFYVRKRKKNK